MQTTPNYRLLSNGQLLDLPATLPVLDPATEQVIANVPDCTQELLDTTVQAAQAAFKDWGATTPAYRRERLEALAARVKEHADELALLLTREQGRPLALAKAEVLGCVHWCRSPALRPWPWAAGGPARG